MNVRLPLSLFLLGICFAPSLALASMSSLNYQINWDDVNAGGDEVASSTDYQISDTIGDVVVGTGTSATYQTSAGYRVGQDEVLAMRVAMRGSTSGVAYSALNTTTKTVTVVSASGFVVGDTIAIVENVGFLQKILVGKIVSIEGTSLILDAMSGSTGLSASPSGDNDLVYVLDGTTASFGSLAVGVEQVATGAVAVRSTVSGGYTVYLQADQPLQSTGHTMTAVADGAVSTGVEEYGYTATGTTALLSTDVPITTAQTAIQTSSGASASPEDRVGVMYKLSIASSTPSGSYSQSVFYTLTANF